jgi:phosphoribosyl-AMP cyclohydrolase
MDEVKFDEGGLVPAIVQDATTGRVLTLAYMSAESLRKSVETGETWFWSRSRRELWHKGETSGNLQHITSISIDCDGDAILVQVHPDGPACHTGETSCFFRSLIQQS